jgi:hypothetical protein
LTKSLIPQLRQRQHSPDCGGSGLGLTVPVPRSLHTLPILRTRSSTRFNTAAVQTLEKRETNSASPGGWEGNDFEVARPSRWPPDRITSTSGRNPKRRRAPPRRVNSDRPVSMSLVMSPPSSRLSMPSLFKVDFSRSNSRIRHQAAAVLAVYLL